MECFGPVLFREGIHGRNIVGFEDKQGLNLELNNGTSIKEKNRKTVNFCDY